MWVLGTWLVAEASPHSLYDCIHVLVLSTRVVPSNVTIKIIIKIKVQFEILFFRQTFQVSVHSLVMRKTELEEWIQGARITTGLSTARAELSS